MQFKFAEKIILAKKKILIGVKWGNMPNNISAGIFWQIWLRIDTF